MQSIFGDSAHHFFGLCDEPQMSREFELVAEQADEARRKCDRTTADIRGMYSELSESLKSMREELKAELQAQDSRVGGEIVELKTTLLQGTQTAEKRSQASAQEVAQLRNDLAEQRKLRGDIIKLQQGLEEAAQLRNGDSLKLQKGLEDVRTEVRSWIQDLRSEVEGWVQELHTNAKNLKASTLTFNDDWATELEEADDKTWMEIKPQKVEESGTGSIFGGEESRKRRTAFSIPGEEKGKAEEGKGKAELRDLEPVVTGTATRLAKLGRVTSVLKSQLDGSNAQLDACKVEMQSLEDQVKELRQDMHRVAEATTIKAGYLAGAMAGADETERRRVHARLVEREKALTGATQGFLFYSAGEVEGAKRVEHFGMSLPEEALEFVVEVDRTQGAKLGLELDDSDGMTLKIISIKPGLIRNWNVACLPPNHPVTLEDHIIQVNEIKGYSRLLAKELVTCKPMKIKIERRRH